MNEEQSRTSSTLLRSAKQGRQTAWERLVNHYSPRVERWTKAAGLQAVDAADVVQEVFIAVAENLRGFQRERPGDSFRAWLRVITNNKIRDHWRTAGKPERRVLSLSLESEPAGRDQSESSSSSVWIGPRSAWFSQCLQAARQVLDNVTERDWQIFQMAAIEERPAAEIAESMKVTANVVYLTKSRILKQLRKKMPVGPGGQDRGQPGAEGASSCK